MLNGQLKLTSYKSLLLQVGQSTCLFDEEEEEKETEEVEGGEVPDWTINLEGAVNHELKCESNDGKVDELRGYGQSSCRINAHFRDV